MKQKIIFGIIVLTVSTIAALNVYYSTNNYNLSDVSLANVEALAISEDNPHDGSPGYGGVACTLSASGHQGQTNLVYLIYCPECSHILTEQKPLSSLCFTFHM